jgi:hypothetical protein
LNETATKRLRPFNQRGGRFGNQRGACKRLREPVLEAGRFEFEVAPRLLDRVPGREQFTQASGRQCDQVLRPPFAREPRRTRRAGSRPRIPSCALRYTPQRDTPKAGERPNRFKPQPGLEPAKALGIRTRHSILLRAGRVIE